MHTFYFIRHGQKQPTIGEPTLTPLGHDQAKATAQYLKQFPIQRIIASPSLRTQQTAEHIAEQLQLSFDTHQLLRERANWGDDPRQTFEQFLEMWTVATHDREYQPPVGDSSKAAGERLEKVVEELRHSTEPQHIALVTHGGVIADFLRNIFGDESLQELVREYTNGAGYHIGECSVTIISFKEKQPVLELLACSTHLERQ